MPSKPAKRTASRATTKKAAAKGKTPAKKTSQLNRSPAARWPFADPPNLAVISLKRIFKQGKPVLYVSHDTDGGWQFLDGDDATDEDAAVVGLGTMVNHDPTLVETATLPLGFTAFRQSLEGSWSVAPTSAAS